MDLAALIEAINKLLAAIGVDPLPETANEDNLVPLLEGVALAIGQVGHEPDGDENLADNDEGDLGADDGSADATGANVGGGVAPSVKMSNMLRGLISEAIDAKVGPLTARLEALSEKAGVEIQSAEDVAKAQYMTFRNALAKGGVTEATLLGKDALAMRLGWDPQLLEGLSPSITMANVSRGAAGINPPEPVTEVETSDAKPTDDEVAARLRARGIDPDKYMPK